MSAFGQALLDQLDGDDLDRLRRRLGIPNEPTAPSPIKPEALLSPAAAAERLSVSVETVRRAIRSGALPAVQIGRAIRISTTDLEAWLDRRRASPGLSQPRSRAGRSTGRRPMRDALAALDPQQRTGGAP